MAEPIGDGCILSRHSSSTPLRGGRVPAHPRQWGGEQQCGGPLPLSSSWREPDSGIRRRR
eukprot:9458394-Pyramimonas_sp.AAC.1